MEIALTLESIHESGARIISRTYWSAASTSRSCHVSGFKPSTDQPLPSSAGRTVISLRPRVGVIAAGHPTEMVRRIREIPGLCSVRVVVSSGFMSPELERDFAAGVRRASPVCLLRWYGRKAVADYRTPRRCPEVGVRQASGAFDWPGRPQTTRRCTAVSGTSLINLAAGRIGADCGGLLESG
jgi:hypothetical protein